MTGRNFPIVWRNVLPQTYDEDVSYPKDRGNRFLQNIATIYIRLCVITSCKIIMFRFNDVFLTSSTHYECLLLLTFCVFTVWTHVIWSSMAGCICVTATFNFSFISFLDLNINHFEIVVRKFCNPFKHQHKLLTQIAENLLFEEN